MYTDKGIILLLGAPNDIDGTLSIIAQERLKHLIKEYYHNPKYFILPTGGFGNHFNISPKPHGYYTTQQLLSKGVPKEKILKWIESSNTIEDVQLSKPIIEKRRVTDLIIVTSNFHRKRAEYIFNKELHNTLVRFSCCETNVPESELRKIKDHERLALERITS